MSTQPTCSQNNAPSYGNCCHKLEKSQHQNRDIAMKALKSRLYQLELDRRSAAVVEAHENKGDAGWGNQ